jgi:hypothetical protein
MVIDLLYMTPEKAQLVAKNIAMATFGSASYKAKDRFCYRFYNMRYNETDYNYLTQVEGKALPAKMKFIPIIRPKIQYLISQLTMMDIMYKVRLVDRDSLNRKIDAKFKAYIDLMDEHLDEAIAAGQYQSQANQMAVQQVLQQLQQNKDPQAQLQAAMLQSRTQLANLGIKEDIEKLSKKHEQALLAETYTASEHLELLGHKLLKWLIDTKNIKEESVLAFTDKVVTGKEIYHVHFNESESHPFLKRVQPLDCYWSADENTRWLMQCRWVSFRYRYTATQMVEYFKPYMSENLLKELNHEYRGKLVYTVE